MAINVEQFIIETIYKVVGAEKANKEIDAYRQKNLNAAQTSPVDPKAGGAIKSITNELGKYGKQVEATAAPTNQFLLALKRAAIVAPVWLAFRKIMTEFFSIIGDGFKTFESFQKSLIKASAVILDNTQSTSSAIKELESTIRKFSAESGVALDKLADTFYRFGTLGIEFKESIAGSIAATKLAISTQGDAATIARSLALSYKLLGDSADQSVSPQLRLEGIAGRIYKLWQTNAFESNEFAKSLENFVSTANVVNLTIDETNALLATLGSAGLQVRGGRLLRTSFLKLLENVDKLAGGLQIAVTGTETQFEVLLKVLGRINELGETGVQSLPELASTIADIFGGVRGSQPILALIALYDQLQDNIKRVGLTSEESAAILQERFLEVKNSVTGQLDIWRNYRKLVGEAFISGVLGGEDFEKALRNLNQLMPTLINNVAAFAGLLRVIGITAQLGIPLLAENLDRATQNSEKLSAALLQVNLALKGKLTGEEITKVIQDLQETSYKTGQNFVNIVSVLKDIQNGVIDISTEEDKAAKNAAQIAKGAIDADNAFQNISEKARKRIRLAEEQAALTQLEVAGFNDALIANIKLNNAVDALVNKQNNLTEVKNGELAAADKLIQRDLVRQGNLTQFQANLIGLKKLDEDIAEITEIASDARIEEVKRTGDLISFEQDLLRLRGASELEILASTSAIERQVRGTQLIAQTEAFRRKNLAEQTKELERQRRNIGDIAIEIEQAKKAGDVGRVTELKSLAKIINETPEQVLATFKQVGAGYITTRNLILENLSAFPDEVRKLIGLELAGQQRLPVPIALEPEFLDSGAGSLGAIVSDELGKIQALPVKANIGNLNVQVTQNITGRMDDGEFANASVESIKQALDDPSVVEKIQRNAVEPF